MDASSCKDEAAFAAEIIQRAVWLSYADGCASDLTRAQWAALRFFGRATRYSQTLTAFADYHATSLASASQTLKVLVAKGLLVRSRSENDSRSARFSLTKKGWLLLETDPVMELVRAISALSRSDLARLSTLMKTVHSSMAEVRRCANLGVCGTCAHFKEPFGQQDDDAVGFCSRVKGDICAKDFCMLCTKYRPQLPATGAG